MDSASLPDISLEKMNLTDLSGNIVELKVYSNNPLVINYWGTWCKPCIEEFPAFEEAKKQFGGKVNFIMVSDEPLEKLVKFKEKNNYTFTFLKSQDPLHKHGLRSFPTTYFYNEEGELVSRKTGSLSKNEIINSTKKTFK
ncbi:MAG: TlpA family protein disulfide reductase [Bacteroidetes bacterium]|nr:TlpA family protein disulfide reductase [Bacteroidota bacterium]